LKKILPILIVGVLILGGLGAVSGADSEKNEIISEKIIFSQPFVEQKDEFVKIRFDESNSYIMEQGKPMLPCYVEKFTFPFGTTIEDVICTPSNIVDQKLSKDIEPTPHAAIVGTNIKAEKIQDNYYGTELYPYDWFEYSVATGLHDGEIRTIVTVQVNPIRYNQADMTIKTAEEVDINILYKTKNIPRSNPVDYEFLIICANEYSDELSSFVTHKEGRGITTYLATLTTVYASASGDDNQEKIKNYIKDAIETWGTTNVLLVGSSTKLPVRTVYCYFAEGGDDEVFISDLYYADIYYGEGLFAKWDSNGNGKHAEYEWQGNTDTDIDYYPDINFGRWACTNGAQVTTMVNKVKTYENTPAYQESWFTNLVVVGGDSFIDEEHDPEGVLEGEFVNEAVITVMDGFLPNRQWASNGKLTGVIPNGVTNIKDAVNTGCGFLDYSGHGNPTTWATHPHLNDNVWIPTPYPGGFYNTHAGQLTNGNKLPIVAIEACSTAKFNQVANCLNWAFMHNANGGAIGSFGATALGWGYIGEYVTQGLIGKMGLDTFRGYKLDDATTLGEMWSNALGRSIVTNMDGAERKTVLEWQCLGDPTLQIAEPSNPPAKPSTPNGPVSGGVNVELTYTSSTTDPDADQVYYLFDWDDGTSSGWLGPYNSGQQVQGKKTWTTTGTYQIKVVAKDTHGKLSEWSDTLSVTVPRNKPLDQSAEGTFTAEMGRRGSSDPEVYLDGEYKTRGRYKIISGTATAGEKQGRFRGIFYSNHFIIRVPTPRITITLFGRCTFDEQTFEGNWISRYPYSRGWINGEFTPS
jgi:hypothetical protein